MECLALALLPVTQSVEANPAAGRVLWLRADQGVTRTFSNLVTRWADASGHGNDVTCSASESLPEWSEVEIGGQPALRFDGNDWLLGSGMPTGSYTKVAVCRLDDGAAVNNVVSSLYHHALWFGGTLKAQMFHAGTFAQSTRDVTVGQPLLLVATYDAASGLGEIHQNGRLVGSGTTASGNWDVSLMLGSFGFGYFMKGAIAEVMVYDRVLDAGELGLLHADLLRRWLRPAPPVIEWIEAPRPGQVLQRDAQDQAVARVTGAVTSPGFTDATLEVTRDGMPYASLSTRLVYGSGGRARFSFAPTLLAGMRDHELAVHLGNGTTRELVARIPAVTVGDVYVVHGQSNAQASDYWGERLGNQSQGRWLRSFGTASIWGTTPLDLHWHRAEGESWWSSGSVGQWALRMAESIANHEQVPIAVLNGAVGGTSIWQHQRNPADPFDQATIYGRLHLRLVEAGVADSFRALLWYQGESDAATPKSWHNGWLALRQDWLADYPALDHLYVIQIRNDCGSGGLAVQEIQRKLGLQHADTTVMSTTALPSHDGCHYYYAGYRELGERMARLLRRDFFGSTDTQEIDAPNPRTAKWTSAAHTAIDLTFRDADDVLVFDPGAEADFTTDLGDVFTSATVAGNVVTLQLAAASNATQLHYKGHALDGPWLRTARGVGALCFFGLPIR